MVCRAALVRRFRSRREIGWALPIPQAGPNRESKTTTMKEVAMLRKKPFLSAGWAAVLSASFFLTAGCPQAEDEGRKIKGKSDEPATPGTRGVDEGSPPSGMRQNPAQPKSKRPGSPD